jgi:hypothetical protein
MTKKQLRVDNLSGIAGINFHRKSNKWRVTIFYNRVDHHIGVFSCFSEAKAHRRAAEECVRGKSDVDI